MKLPENSLLAKWAAAGGVARLPRPWCLGPVHEHLFNRAESLVWISTPGEPRPIQRPKTAHLTDPHALMLYCVDADLTEPDLWHSMRGEEVHPGDAMYPGVHYAAYIGVNDWGVVGSCWRYKQPPLAVIPTVVAPPVDEDAAERERQRRFFFGPRWTGGMR